MLHLLNSHHIKRLNFWLNTIAIVIVLFLFQRLLKSLPTGSEFMSEPAGLVLSFSMINIDIYSSYWTIFIACCLNTLLVGGLSIILSSAIAILIASLRRSEISICQQFSSTYVSLIRNLPLLAVIIGFYFSLLYVLPQPTSDNTFIQLNKKGLFIETWPWIAVGLKWLMLWILSCPLVLSTTSMKRSIKIGVFVVGILVITLIAIYNQPRMIESYRIPLELFALTIALSIYSSSYLSEIIRSGFNSIHHTQNHTIRSIGLSHWQGFYLVYLPQIIRKIIPPVISQYANIIKNASLGAVIGYPDVIAIFSGTVINQTGNTYEVIFLTCCFYAAINLLISLLLTLHSRRYYEQ